MATEDRSLDGLIAVKIRAGNFDAEVEAWVRRFSRKAMTFAIVRFGHRPEDAEDLIQIFWVWLWQNRLRTYDAGRGSLFSYCFRIFVNLLSREGTIVAQEIRDRAVELPSDAADGTGLSPEQLYMLEEALTAAFGALTPCDRDLITWRFIDGRSDGELSDALNITPGTLRVRVHRAVVRLREHLASLGFANG